MQLIGHGLDWTRGGRRLCLGRPEIGPTSARWQKFEAQHGPQHDWIMPVSARE